MNRRALPSLSNFVFFSLACCVTPIAAQTIIFEQELSPLPIGSTPYIQRTQPESSWQPSMTYPGQAGYPSIGPANSWESPSVPLSLPIAQEATHSHLGELIISEEPVDGIIIGYYENGQLIQNPSYSGLPAPYELPEVYIGNTIPESASDSAAVTVLPEVSSQPETGTQQELSVALKRSAARISALEAELATINASRESMVKDTALQIESLRLRLEETGRELKLAVAEKSDAIDKMKSQLAQSTEESTQLKIMLERAETALSKAKKEKKQASSTIEKEEQLKRDASSKISSLEKENSSLRSKMDQAAKLVIQLEKELKQIQLAHASQVAELGKTVLEKADSHKDLIQKLAYTEKRLEEQTKMNAELKAQFMKAYESAKESKATIARLGKEQLKAESQVREKAKGNNQRENVEVKPNLIEEQRDELSSKEKRIASKIAELRKEMKKKMEDARKRIEAVGKKKIDALMKTGKDQDSDEIKEMKEKVNRSMKVSDRKIRARYERKILQVK